MSLEDDVENTAKVLEKLKHTATVEELTAARELLRMCRSNSAAWRELVRGLLEKAEWVASTDNMPDDMLRLALEQWVSAQPDFAKIMDAARAKLDRVKELHARLEGVAPLWASELAKVLEDKLEGGP